jgi:hypothetical protein
MGGFLILAVCTIPLTFFSGFWLGTVIHHRKRLNGVTAASIIWLILIFGGLRRAHIGGIYPLDVVVLLALIHAISSVVGFHFGWKYEAEEEGRKNETP